MKYLLFIASLVFSLHINAANFNEQINAAQKTFTEKNYPDAIKLLHDALENADNVTDKTSALNALGWSYFKDKQYNLAKTYLERVLALAEKAGDLDAARKTSNNLGVLAYTMGDYEKAQSQFTTAPSQRSNAASTYLNLIEQQQQANTVNQYIAQGIHLRRSKDFQGAIEQYDKALAITPKNVRALEYKGYAQFRLGNSHEAVETLTTAIKIDPNRLNTLINLMKALCSVQDKNKLASLATRFHDQIQQNKASIKADRELLSTCKDSFISVL